MRVDGELRYMAPHEIPTRDQELQNKTEELIRRDASGHLRAHDEAKMPDADTRTDLRLRQAYTRRGLALEVADVMTFTIHEKLVDKLLQEYQREPPAGYSQVTLSQLTAADRRAWKLMSEGPMESGSDRRPRADPELCTEHFFANRHCRRSENVIGSATNG